MSEPTIRDYVQHKPTCEKSRGRREARADECGLTEYHFIRDDRCKCTCGLDDLLAGLSAPLCQVCEKPQPCPDHGRTPVTDADYEELSRDVAADIARQQVAVLSAPHETAYDEAVMSAYQQAQDNWSAQCFCFTSAPESMRRTAHEVARDGFSEIVKTLGPLARPLLDAEYEEARQRSNFDDCLRCGAEPLNMSQTPDRRIDEGTEIERTRAHQRRRAVDADRALDAGEVAQQGAERH